MLCTAREHQVLPSESPACYGRSHQGHLYCPCRGPQKVRLTHFPPGKPSQHRFGKGFVSTALVVLLDSHSIIKTHLFYLKPAN